MTPKRYQKIRQMLAQRQPDLSVCLDRIHKPHNLAAMMRNCDAVGAHHLHMIWNTKHEIRTGTSVGSQNWLKLHKHQHVREAISHFKQQKMQVLVTNLSEQSVDYREVDYTQPTAIIFGQEKYGVCEESIAAADHQIIVPMVGMVQSLNVSVAGALILYEAQRQRELADMYNSQRLDEEECQRILFENGYPQLHKMCLIKQLPFPHIDDKGQVNASEEWWQRMRRDNRVDRNADAC